MMSVCIMSLIVESFRIFGRYLMSITSTYLFAKKNAVKSPAFQAVMAQILAITSVPWIIAAIVWYLY